MTNEQSQYGVKWLKCTRCGLVDASVVTVDGRELCKDPDQCARVIRGEALGGKPLQLRGPLVRFDLSPDEAQKNSEAVADWQSRQLVEVDLPELPTNGVTNGAH